MNFVEEYKNNMLAKATQELKVNKGLCFEIKAVNGDSKLTIDGINYFNEIVGVEIYDHNIKIGEYNFGTKILTTPKNIKNIAVLKNQVNLINNFVGYEKFSIKQNVLNGFYNYMDSVDEGLSEFEVAQMYEFCR